MLTVAAMCARPMRSELPHSRPAHEPALQGELVHGRRLGHGHVVEDAQGAEDEGGQQQSPHVQRRTRRHLEEHQVLGAGDARTPPRC